MKIIRTAAMESLEARWLMSAGAPAVDQSRLIFSDISGGAPAPAQHVTLTNNTGSAIALAAGDVRIDGPDAAEFSLASTNTPLPTTIPAGGTLDLGVVFGASRIGPAGATLHIGSGASEVDVTLRGLGTKGLYGEMEPSLQWILDTYQIPVLVGDSDPTTNPIELSATALSDEVPMTLLAKAGPGPVTVDPIAAYTNPSNPVMQFGYYNFGADAKTNHQIFSVPMADAQTLAPHVIGTDSFDPGTTPFGLYSVWPQFAGRISYSEDFRNTWKSTNPALIQSMRFYPLKNADGSVVPNAYIMGNEEATNQDFQDGVFIVRNVRLASPSQSPGGFAASVINAHEVDVKWIDRSINETGFIVERSTAGGAFKALPMTGPNVTTFHDTTVVPGTKYAYRVRAAGTDGTSAVTGAVSVATPSTTVVYQAETGVLTGATVAKTYAGWYGTGYVSFTNANGGSIDMKVTAAAAGTYTLGIRYANGSTANRSLQLQVNGTAANQLSFLPLGAWTTWKTLSFTITLKAGVNDIVLSTVGNLGPNIDLLTIS